MATRPATPPSWSYRAARWFVQQPVLIRRLLVATLFLAVGVPTGVAIWLYWRAPVTTGQNIPLTPGKPGGPIARIWQTPDQFCDKYRAQDGTITFWCYQRIPQTKKFMRVGRL